MTPEMDIDVDECPKCGGDCRVDQLRDGRRMVFCHGDGDKIRAGTYYTEPEE